MYSYARFLAVAQYAIGRIVVTYICYTVDCFIISSCFRFQMKNSNRQRSQTSCESVVRVEQLYENNIRKNTTEKSHGFWKKDFRLNYPPGFR